MSGQGGPLTPTDTLLTVTDVDPPIEKSSLESLDFNKSSRTICSQRQVLWPVQLSVDLAHDLLRRFASDAVSL